MALAPVPITATRLPVRSASASHRAEWKRTPAKSVMPSISGRRGSDRLPEPVISVVARISPRLVRTRHDCSVASQRASSSSVWKWNRSRVPDLAATAWR